MAMYEYGITIEGNKSQRPYKKDLVIVRDENCVKIKLQGKKDSQAIVAFWSDGEVVLYTGNAEDSGFKPRAS